MTTTKSFTKKFLSVVLSVLMVMTSISVMFVAIADDNDPTAALAEVLKNGAVTDLTSYVTSSNANSTVIYFPTYEKYSPVADALEKLDAAVKVTDAYGKKGNKGSDAAYPEDVKTDLLANLGNYMSAEEIASNEVSTFLDMIASMTGITKSANQNKTQNNVTASVSNVITVTTDDYQGYLKQAGTYADVADPVYLGTVYTLKSERVTNVVKESNGCGGTDNVNYYHSSLSSSSVANNNGTSVKPTLTTYKNYLDSVDFSLSYEDKLNMVMNNTMEAFYNEFKAKYDDIVDYVGSVDTYNKIFADKANAVEEMFKTCESAMDVQTYIAIANQWKDYSENNPNYGVYNYGAYDYDEMVAAYNDFMQIYSALEAGGADLLDYLNKYEYISIDYYNNFTDNVVVYDLAEVKAAVDAICDIYADSDIDAIALEEKQAAYSLLAGYTAAIEKYSEQVKASIFTEGTGYIKPVADKLYCEINEYVAYFVDVVYSSTIDKSTDDIIATVNESEEKLPALNAFYADVKVDLGDERAEAILGALVDAANAFKNNALDILAARFEAEVEYANDLYIALGEPTDLDIAAYIKLKSAFGNLEETIPAYLDEKGAADKISADVYATYNALNETVLVKFNEFKSTFGLAVYEQTELSYAAREVYVNDKVKTEAYDVTAENIGNVIEKLDALLTSQAFGDLVLGGETLGDMLMGLVTDKIYSDDFINTVVNLLYPLIYDVFSDLFVDTLPKTIPDGTALVGGKTIKYKQDLKTVLKNAGLLIHPQLLGETVPDEYAEAKAALLAASGTTYAANPEFENPWQNENIYDSENEKLTIKWGVDEAAPEDKEQAFYDAFAAAMYGFRPLLIALLCNADWKAKEVSNVASVTVLVEINASLVLDASGNAGYVNALGPLFEALGCDSSLIRNSAQLTAYANDTSHASVENILRAIFEPIVNILDKIGNAPVDTVLSILPNLMYVLSTEMVTPILSMLKTSVNYSAEALGSFSIIHGNYDVDVGEMLDIEDLLGVSLSAGLDGILSAFGIDIPEIDAATVSTLGELVEIDTVRSDYIYNAAALGLANGKAVTIKADKADVGYYVLSYVADLLQDTEALEGLLNSVLGLVLKKDYTDEDDNVDQEALDAKIAETVEKVLGIVGGLDIKSTGDLIAAVIELLNDDKYPEAQFVYPAAGGSSIAENVSYSVFWTEAKATYVADNVQLLVEKICDLLLVDYVEEIQNLISKLYSADNIAAIADLVNGLLANVLEDETITDIIDIVDPLVDIDVTGILDAVSAYEVPEFENGDRDAFITALVDYVTPLVPVLKLLLIGDTSVNLLDGIVKINGYNGYNSGLVPVLEALGCQVSDITPYDTFKTLDDRAMVEAVIDPILNLLDATLDEDPINGVLAILPNILYFIDNGGLQQAVDNILRPVYVVLDIVRPVFDVDLTLNLNLNEVLTDLFASLTEDLPIRFPGYSELSDVLKGIGAVETYQSATGAQAVRLSVNGDAITPEFVTAILRLLVSTMMFSDNSNVIVDYVKDNTDLSPEAIADLENMLDQLAGTQSVDVMLSVLFYVFFGANTGVDGAIAIRGAVADAIISALESIGLSTSDEFRDIVDRVGAAIESIAGSVDDAAGTNVFIEFVTKIADFFRTVIDKFLAIFKL